MWLAILLALAIIAFFIVKYMKGKGERQQDANDQLTDTSAGQNSLAQSTAEPSAIKSGSSNPASGAKSAPAPAVQHQPDAAAQSLSTSTHTAVGVGTAAAGVASLALDSGNTLADVREMIKILNLAEPDASRLAISPEELRALRNADQSGAPSEQALTELAGRLRKMLA
ncbi:MAG: hypothetical protein AB8B63_16850 [Granulosicoccus sp.]